MLKIRTEYYNLCAIDEPAILGKAPEDCRPESWVYYCGELPVECLVIELAKDVWIELELDYDCIINSDWSVCEKSLGNVYRSRWSGVEDAAEIAFDYAGIKKEPHEIYIFMSDVLKTVSMWMANNLANNRKLYASYLDLISQGWQAA